MAEDVCSSCKRRVSNMPGTVKFACPNCGDSEITRCTQCRKIVAKYTCPKCGFVGPN
ncbi:RNA-binding protein [Candidatus Woesearchaeota archaeon]|jgi:Zn-ribbon RNA-binding protein|nr:RNA-binding protein [Candidatus Woesearchaeota archaeon]MBT6519186.1 RNA-binding protein [Candidatus Woesearchaeota archaeon]MBT7367656.1 RNA-binding protein [Candidatus Woesearchaeota archaeon]